jgi:hypothetical protein
MLTVLLPARVCCWLRRQRDQLQQFVADQDKRKKQHKGWASFPTEARIKETVDEQEGVQREASRGNTVNGICGRSAAENPEQISRDDKDDDHNQD